MNPIITKLAGVTFDDCQRNIKLLGNPGINEFDINRYPENPKDPNAIWIGFGKYKLGYLPSHIAKEVSPLMQEGKNFAAMFVSVNRSPFHENIGMTVKITERPKAREALKIVMLSLIEAAKTGGRVRISRDKNNYCDHKMYGKLWLKHKWLVEIAIDGLIELGYVEFQNGCWDKEKRRGLQSKIEASNKLLARLKGFLMPSNSKVVERTAPEQIIQLKDRHKKLVHYTGLKPIIKMRERLEQYNKFIQEQYITVNLTEPVWTDNEFWLNNLLRGLLNGRYTEVKSLLSRAKLTHTDIADDIGSGKGRMLQNLDSRITDAILTSLMAENIPALTVHDSFIVPQQHEDRLRELMIDEYEKVLKFKPGISTKKKRLRPKKWDN
jgi:hypothetical protein